MIANEIKISYIGGPTVVLEIAGLRLLTDPTFDGAGTQYNRQVYTLHKLQDPLTGPDAVGKIDIVLLSHDHHLDNLDNAGREFLSHVPTVYTTPDGAARLGGNSKGLKNWEAVEVSTPDGRVLTITGTPCQHGPVDGERGPVTGFVLQLKDEPGGGVYITGDTVWFKGVEEVAKRFSIALVLAFMGAAVVNEIGSQHLTFSAEEGILIARCFDKAIIMPLHFEGWAHFSESRAVIEETFKKEGLSNRLKWPPDSKNPTA